MTNKQKYTPVRFSHLTSYAGVGAIVRGVEDKLMVMTDTRFWTDKTNNISAEIIPYVKRACMSLGIDHVLRMPPKASEKMGSDIVGSYLPAVLFPTYAICKKCGLLHNNPWRKQKVELSEKVFCTKNTCNGLLEQITWCAVSNRGHLSDVPWHAVCHQDSDTNCKPDFGSEYLELHVEQNGRKAIKCNKCGSKKYFENSRLYIIGCEQPWLRSETPLLENGDYVEILEVNNPGVYMPERVNALIIPPESRLSKGSIVHQLFSNSRQCREIENIQNPLRKKGKLKELASKYRCSIKDIEQALCDIKDGYPYANTDFTVGELLEDEYNAFLKPIEDVADDEDFVTKHKTKEWHSLIEEVLSPNLKSIINIVGQHVIVSRLREIQIFKGFYRITQENKENLVPPDIIGKSDWLPAIELFGEGFFFTLDKNILKKWEKIPAVIKRAEEIRIRYEKSEVTVHKEPKIIPRFLLLHTLSHLLIRELEITAGYPAASIKERIYCKESKDMAGILIYTAVADIVGSLGGIVESSEPKEFLKLMSRAFKHAQWCSLDPVCMEHEGQGPGWLNRAACHGCALIPEPSCEFNNVFLDRVFIKGNKKLGIPNFLEFASEESKA